MRFSSESEHTTWLEKNSLLPGGFQVATHTFSFEPKERKQEASMTMSLICLDEGTSSFASMFTQNKFPGAPVIIGRKRSTQPSVRAVLINNKISNVGVSTGIEDAEATCLALSEVLSCSPDEVIPSSTGIIGWRIPVDDMTAHIDALSEALQPESVLPLAKGIMTTDLYPKIRRTELGGGSIVAIAKGAGMVEPNLATMLVFILTDIKIARGDLREVLPRVVARSFNSISIDSDQSTSDTVLALSSNQVSGVSVSDFEKALSSTCISLAQDVVRNGEGVHHVIEVQVDGAMSESLARGLGKSIVRSPLLKTAICGNDPNVGRLIMALGNFVPASGESIDYSKIKMTIGDEVVFDNGSFLLSQEKETKLSTYMKEAELYSSDSPSLGAKFKPPFCYPAHELNLRIGISLSQGQSSATVWGGDLTHEYITENADYRS